MSSSYITPTHDNIGDYKITDTLFNSDSLDAAISNLQISSSFFNDRINQNISNITDLYTSAEYAVVSVNALKLSVDDLYISANYIPELVQSIQSALTKLDVHDSDIDYLSGVVEELNLRALKHAITDVGILKPEEANALYLKISVFNAAEMSDVLGTIDMCLSDDWKYFKVLLVNNGENATELADSPLNSEYLSGTQWIDPATMDEAIKTYNPDATGFEGYGTAFNNSPVNISFLQWLNDKNLSANLSGDSRFYLRYEWYYVDENNEIHKSDHYSMMVPSFGEVGAKAGASVSKSEIQELKQALEPDVATVSYVSEEEIEELDGETNTGLVDYPTTGFYIEPHQCSILENFSDNNDKKIIFQSYSEGKTYKMKFSTGSSTLSVGNRASSTTIAFYANQGNGPEKIDELNNTSLTFAANKTYFIAVNLEMIQILAVK